MNDSKFPKKYFLTLLWTWQIDIFVWLFVLIVHLFCGERLSWFGLTLQCETKRQYLFNLFGKRKISGMTLGHGIILSQQSDQFDFRKTEKHEQGHVEQFEGNMFFTTVISILIFAFSQNRSIAFLITLFSIWFFGGFMIYFSRSVQAFIMGEDIYRGNADEESMYSRTKE
jgi:hypothetical protein